MSLPEAAVEGPSSAYPRRPGASAGGVVQLEGVVKRYGGTVVLDHVDLTLAPGTVHGLVGQNGAGKSTLMKVLCGAVRPDGGRLLVDGTAVSLRRPADALAHGIGLISQELASAAAMTVRDNVFMGSWANRASWTRSQEDRTRFERLCADVGFEIDPDAVMGDLTVAQQQQVEILRAVSRGTRLLVMDEPTAVLTERETTALLQLIRRLAARDTTVVLISHFLGEVLQVCDTVTVLRDGKHVLTEPTSRHTPESLVQAMTGERVEALYPVAADPADDAPVVLDVRALCRGTAVQDATLQVRAGEVLGLSGLVGSGRSELARLVFGADRADGGEVWVCGSRLRQGSPRQAMRAGIAMVPESRKEQGLFMSFPVAPNVALASMQETSWRGVRRPGRERRLVSLAVERLNVRSANADGPVWTLSGGNQQKVLFAKWLARRPRVLIVDEPTRGVDISTKVQIHRLISDLAESGVAVLLISSELDEVLALSHRVAVMRQGRVVTTLTKAEADPGRVLAAAFADEKESR